MAEDFFKNKGINVSGDRPVALFDIRDPIIVDSKQSFVHHHSSSNSGESYYVYSGSQKVTIDISKPTVRSSFYLQLDKKGEVFFPSLSCTITHSQPPDCKTISPQIEIFTSSGYRVYSGGVEICSDLCFERMKQSLGRYYALPEKMLPSPIQKPISTTTPTGIKVAPPYDVIMQKINSSDLGIRAEGIMAAGERKEKRSVDLLKNVVEDRNPNFKDLRLLAYSSLAELPFSEAATLLVDQFSQAETDSSEVSSLALALCCIPKFLRTADRIVSLQTSKIKHPEEVEMIFKAWGVSLETPVPQEIVAQYGPLPNPPPHPVTLEWLADEIDNQLKKYPHINRQTEGQYIMPSSVRDVVGLQGVLYPFYIFMQSLESKELRNDIGKYLEADFKDKMTEYGVFFTYEKNKVQPHLLAPASWGNNYEYQPPSAVFRLPEIKGFLFFGHLHSLPSSEKYAGPSQLGDHLKGDLWNSNQLVITRLEKGEFNVDWYDHQYGVLDMGTYPYDTSAIKAPE